MKSSLLTLTLTLGALSASAATIPRGGGADDTTTDPMLFMYKISFNETCSTLSWDGLQAFRRSHMPAGGCLPIADFAGRSDEQIRTVLVLETINNGECASMWSPEIPSPCTCVYFALTPDRSFNSPPVP